MDKGNDKYLDDILESLLGKVSEEELQQLYIDAQNEPPIEIPPSSDLDDRVHKLIKKEEKKGKKTNKKHF